MLLLYYNNVLKQLYEANKEINHFQGFWSSTTSSHKKRTYRDIQISIWLTWLMYVTDMRFIAYEGKKAFGTKQQ